VTVITDVAIKGSSPCGVGVLDRVIPKTFGWAVRLRGPHGLLPSDALGCLDTSDYVESKLAAAFGPFVGLFGENRPRAG